MMSKILKPAAVIIFAVILVLGVIMGVGLPLNFVM